MNDTATYVLSTILWSIVWLCIGFALGYLVGIRRKLERIESELDTLTHRSCPKETPDDDA